MRYACFLFFLPVFLSAQPRLLKNPDIVWAINVEQDWRVDAPDPDLEWDAGVTTLKMLRTPKNEADGLRFSLAMLVYRAAAEGNLAIFRDAACQVPTTLAEAYPTIRDTVFPFDPEGYGGNGLAINIEPRPNEDIKAWRLQQFLVYDKKHANWSTTVTAIAPLVAAKSPEGQAEGLRPLFWFRPDNRRPSLQSAGIVWAKKTKNKQPQTAIKAVVEHPLKVVAGFQNPLQHQLQLFDSDAKALFYDAWNEKLLTLEERKNQLVRIDTALIFDAKTYQPEAQIVRTELDINDLRLLRLVQTWYWDERRGRLSICLDAVAPLQYVRDNEGDFRFWRPLFYRRATKT